MFSLTTIPPVSILSMYTTIVTGMMLLRTVHNEVQSMINQLLPQHLRDKIISKFGALFGDGDLSRMILIINQQDSLYSINEVYEASEVYLSHKFTPSVQQLQVSKASKDKAFTITINKGQKVIDTFDGMELQWEFLSTESQKSHIDFDTSELSIEKMVHKSIQLSFHSKYKEKALSTYLPYVVERSQAIAAEHRVVKLHALGSYGGEVNLDHPSTFETLAMDPSVKSELMEDLDRFVKRKEFYKRVGKAWKRGYLLYGPPGTGKSSLIAAMANYLKFDIYELDLTSLQRNSDLRSLLLSTTNKSILVIEDIDCGIELQNRTNDETDNSNNTKLTLSGLLNFIDGLWSSCGDERIIVFTTNYKERLDPALVRPGRMDKHIHMSYCTPPGFKILARNYLQINTHHLFPMIEQLILEVEVTPAQVAEELMKSEDIDVVLRGLLQFLQLKKCPETTNTSGSSLGKKRSSESDLGEVHTKRQRSPSPEQEDEGFMLG